MNDIFNSMTELFNNFVSESEEFLQKLKEQKNENS